jgi:hypothetical protein
MRQCFLSTRDNPFDPYEQFASWFMFDVEKGYDCCGRLDRIAKTSEEFSEEENEIEIEKAIDEIIKYDFTNTYTKVVKELADAG